MKVTALISEVAPSLPSALKHAAVLATSFIPRHCGPLPPEVCLHAKHFLCSLLQQVGGWYLLQLQVHREFCCVSSDGQAAADQLHMPRACGTKDFHIAAERRATIQRPPSSYKVWTFFWSRYFLLVLFFCSILSEQKLTFKASIKKARLSTSH